MIATARYRIKATIYAQDITEVSVYHLDTNENTLSDRLDFYYSSNVESVFPGKDNQTLTLAEVEGYERYILEAYLETDPLWSLMEPPFPRISVLGIHLFRDEFGLTGFRLYGQNLDTVDYVLTFNIAILYINTSFIFGY